jgi:hypothetical protein
MGRSFANLAPNKESHPIHPTQELPGSALTLGARSDGLDYFVWIGSPGEGLGLGIVVEDEAIDCGLQVDDR